MRVRLDKLVESITVGQILSRVASKDIRYEDGFTTKVLMPSAISGGTIHTDGVAEQIFKKEVAPDKITEVGDIVIKLSSPFDCGFIEDGYEGLVVPNYCAILRGIDVTKVSPYYLLGFMNSQYMSAVLLKNNRSSASSMIRQSTLAETEIALPSLDEQEVTGKVYWASCLRVRELQKLAEIQLRVGSGIVTEQIMEVLENEVEG